MPHNWLNRLLGNDRGSHQIVQNNRDSLFSLPLAPPPPEYQGKVNLAARRLSEDVNRAITNFSVAHAQRQLAEVSEEEWLKRGEQRALALFHTTRDVVVATVYVEARTTQIVNKA